MSTQQRNPQAPPARHRAGPDLIDPRGPRLAATLTAVVLTTVLLTAPGPVAVALLAAQAVAFGLGARLGVQRSPYGLLFRTLVRPRLGPPTEWEDAAPPRFAQGVGLGFALVGLAGLFAGATTLGLVAVGLALTAAVLNAAFGFCLGCEVYLLARRLGRRGTGSASTAASGTPTPTAGTPATAAAPASGS